MVGKRTNIPKTSPLNVFGRVVRSDQTKASNTIGSVLWLLFDLIFRIALAVSTQGSTKERDRF